MGWSVLADIKGYMRHITVMCSFMALYSYFWDLAKLCNPAASVNRVYMKREIRKRSRACNSLITVYIYSVRNFTRACASLWLDACLIPLAWFIKKLNSVCVCRRNLEGYQLFILYFFSKRATEQSGPINQLTHVTGGTIKRNPLCYLPWDNVKFPREWLSFITLYLLAKYIKDCQNILYHIGIVCMGILVQNGFLCVENTTYLGTMPNSPESD